MTESTFAAASNDAVDSSDYDWMRIAYEDLPVGVCCVDLVEYRILYRNPALAGVLGHDLQDASLLASWMESLPGQPEPSLIRDKLLLLRHSRVESSPGPDTRSEMVPPTLKARYEGTREVLLSAGRLPGGRIAVATFVDVTESRQKERSLEEALRRAEQSSLFSRRLLDRSEEMIILCPGSGRMRYASPAVEQVTGWTPEEYVAHELDQQIHPEDLQTLCEARRKMQIHGSRQPVRYRTRHKDGSYRWVEGNLSPYDESESGADAGYVANLRDITKQKEQQDTLVLENSQLAKLARIDEVTGIANRRVFNDALNREARRKMRSTHSLAVLLLDVDNFKRYNDLYGHLQGDACLRLIAQTLKRTLHRVADLVARYGGEEFVMLLPMTESEGAEQVARNVLAAIAALRIPHAGTPSGIVSLSIGVSTWPASRTMDEATLLTRADQALYEAKRAGRNQCRISDWSTDDTLND